MNSEGSVCQYERQIMENSGITSQVPPNDQTRADLLLSFTPLEALQALVQE